LRSKGFNALTELQNLMKSPNPTKAQFLELSNKFYTLIPHNFGHQSAPLIGIDFDAVEVKL
jgi:hypothetical protein